MPPLLIGEIDYLDVDMSAVARFSGPVILYRGRGGLWRAFWISDRHMLTGIYVAPATGSLVVLSQWGVEGPMGFWNVFKGSHGLSRRMCGAIPYPDRHRDHQDLVTDGFRGEIAAVEADRLGGLEVTATFVEAEGKLPEVVRYVSKPGTLVFAEAPSEKGVGATTAYQPVEFASAKRRAEFVRSLRRQVGLK